MWSVETYSPQRPHSTLIHNVINFIALRVLRARMFLKTAERKSAVRDIRRNVGQRLRLLQVRVPRQGAPQAITSDLVAFRVSLMTMTTTRIRHRFLACPLGQHLPLQGMIGVWWRAISACIIQSPVCIGGATDIPNIHSCPGGSESTISYVSL